MSKTIALLSGKGGSGKTTVSLSIASMLSNCGVRTLLIDADLSTNGATYFYENKLSNNNMKIASFCEILNGEKDIEEFIHINEYFDFCPSILQIIIKNVETFSYHGNNEELNKKFNEVLTEKYDVILFDCQAGYADILKIILPLVDINLIVMEADAISSAAIRSLYLKIGDIIEKKKVYQVFNKATPEEYEIYSKVTGGTVFTNIETIIFDWKIRKAFSVAQIPDMESTSASYGKQIYNICKILFTEERIADKLKKYEMIIELIATTERKEKLEDSIKKSMEEYNRERKSKIVKMLNMITLPITVVMFCSMFVYLIEKRVFSFDLEFSITVIASLIALLATVFSAWTSMYDSLKERKYKFRELEIYRNDLSKVNIEIRNIQEKLELANEEICLERRQ